MKNSIIRQAIYDLKSQPVIGCVTIIGTALSIFLIMVVVMVQQVGVVSFAPETNRNRTLYGKYIHTKNDSGGDSSSSMSAEAARKLYGDLKSAEASSVFYDAEMTIDVNVPGKPTSVHYIRPTDDQYFRVFEYKFLSGRPFDRAEFESDQKVVVITDRVANEFFGSTDVAGQEILIGREPYRIMGVVESVSPLASFGFSEVWRPYSLKDEWNADGDVFGPFSAAILARSSADFDAIRAEVQTRKNALNAELKDKDEKLVDHGTPYTQETVNNLQGSNNDPSDKESRRQRYIIYAILLLVPAINLSAMTQSRLRRRISEIGVWRAFGSTRMRIILNILAENLVVTVAGGLLGLIFCLIFGYFFADSIFPHTNFDYAVTISAGVVFDWHIFAIALLFCFVLNLLSSGLPAWRASRVNPVDAINSRVI